MWDDAQRDGRRAEYTWRPLINATVWLTPTTQVPCSNADLNARLGRKVNFAAGKMCIVYQPRRRHTWCKVWLASGERRRCSNEAKKRNPLKFAGVPKTPEPISVAKIQPDKVVRWCADGEFLRPVFPASRVQHISDLHS